MSTPKPVIATSPDASAMKEGSVWQRKVEFVRQCRYARTSAVQQYGSEGTAHKTLELNGMVGRVYSSGINRCGCFSCSTFRIGINL